MKNDKNPYDSAMDSATKVAPAYKRMKKKSLRNKIKAAKSSREKQQKQLKLAKMPASPSLANASDSEIENKEPIKYDKKILLPKMKKR